MKTSKAVSSFVWVRCWMLMFNVQRFLTAFLIVLNFPAYKYCRTIIFIIVWIFYVRNWRILPEWLFHFPMENMVSVLRTRANKIWAIECRNRGVGRKKTHEKFPWTKNAWRAFENIVAMRMNNNYSLISLSLSLWCVQQQETRIAKKESTWKILLSHFSSLFSFFLHSVYLLSLPLPLPLPLSLDRI